MTLGGDVEHLAQGPLAMGTVQGDEATELVPAGLQLAPFGQVAVLVARLVKLLLSGHIAVLDAEAALVHAPEGDARHREVQAGSHLCPHVFPAGADVAAPGGGRVALFAGKTAAGEQEHALVVARGTLAGIDGVGVDDRVGVEIFGRAAQGRGA